LSRVQKGASTSSGRCRRVCPCETKPPTSNTDSPPPTPTPVVPPTGSPVQPQTPPVGGPTLGGTPVAGAPVAASLAPTSKTAAADCVSTCVCRTGEKITVEYSNPDPHPDDWVGLVSSRTDLLLVLSNIPFSRFLKT
jgi:hypothetical protein